jgi:hypothetical protein
MKNRAVSVCGSDGVNQTQRSKKSSNNDASKQKSKETKDKGK